jgi:hypothetical protein
MKDFLLLIAVGTVSFVAAYKFVEMVAYFLPPLWTLALIAAFVGAVFTIPKSS